MQKRSESAHLAEGCSFSRSRSHCWRELEMPISCKEVCCHHHVKEGRKGNTYHLSAKLILLFDLLFSIYQAEKAGSNSSEANNIVSRQTLDTEALLSFTEFWKVGCEDNTRGIFQKKKKELGNPTSSPPQRSKNDAVYKADLVTETIA